MRIVQAHRVPHARERVWRVLLDPEIMARVLPGVQSFEPAGSDRYEVVLELGVSAVKGTYKGSIVVASQDFPVSYVLRGEGKGAQGWVRGEATLTLSDEDGGTRIAAEAEVQIGGRIAALGQRMFEGVARAMAGEMFASIERELEGAASRASSSGFALRAALAWLRALLARLLGRGPRPEAR